MFLFIVVSNKASANEKLVRMLVIFFMELAKKLGVVVLLALWWERCSFHRLNRVFTAHMEKLSYVSPFYSFTKLMEVVQTKYRCLSYVESEIFGIENVWKVGEGDGLGPSPGDASVSALDEAFLSKGKKKKPDAKPDGDEGADDDDDSGDNCAASNDDEPGGCGVAEPDGPHAHGVITSLLDFLEEQALAKGAKGKGSQDGKGGKGKGMPEA